MKLDNMIAVITQFISTHTIVALAVAAVIALLAYKKPKQTLKVVTMVLFFLAVVYIGMYVQEAFFSGVEFKGDIIEKQENY